MVSHFSFISQDRYDNDIENEYDDFYIKLLVFG